MSKRYLFFHFLLLFLFTAGCRRSQQVGTADLQIELVAPLFPTLDGSTEMALRVTDAAGQPVDDAQLAVKGDMTHAGMVPVLAESGSGSDGLYTLPFAWTMAGDWIVTVRATLPDGTWAEQQFNLSVSADEECETDEAE